MFVDTCHAGGAIGGEQIVRDPLFQLSGSRTGAVVFSASSLADESIEVDGNGVFTRALLETLTDTSSDDDKPQDYKVSISEMYRQLDRRVRRLSNNLQIPEMQKPSSTPDIPLFAVPGSGA